MEIPNKNHLKLWKIFKKQLEADSLNLIGMENKNLSIIFLVLNCCSDHENQWPEIYERII